MIQNKHPTKNLVREEWVEIFPTVKSAIEGFDAVNGYVALTQGTRKLCKFTFQIYGKAMMR